MLDVGQGDSVLIRTAEKTVLIDAGIKKANVVDQLRSLGVDHLDLLVSTHPHADHIGGMAAVVNAFDVSLYLDNGLPHTTQTYLALMTALKDRDVPYRSATTGLQLRLGDEALLTVLNPNDPPLRGTRSDLNSNSVVLRLDHEDISFLFTGDAEDPTERALLSADLQRVDVLKVAHHGSGHSTSSAFLKAAAPTYALVSCGADNRYGHPDPETMGRLRDAGVQIYRTDRSSHIRALSDGASVELLEGNLHQIANMRDPFEARVVVKTPPVVAPAPKTVTKPPVAEPLTRKQQRLKKKADKKAERERRQ